MADKLNEALTEYSEKVGHEIVFKPEQKLAIEHLLQNRDVLAVLPTGFGKSLIFQHYIFVKRRDTPNAAVIVITPLASIVKDQQLEAKLLGLRACCLSEASLEELHGMEIIFANAEDVTTRAFRNKLKLVTSALHQAVEALVGR